MIDRKKIARKARGDEGFFRILRRELMKWYKEELFNGRIKVKLQVPGCHQKSHKS